MTVKVADFGLSRDVYATDYYTMSQSVPLPVKWLAPEALFDRTFSERTDVVSGCLVLCSTEDITQLYSVCIYIAILFLAKENYACTYLYIL